MPDATEAALARIADLRRHAEDYPLTWAHDTDAALILDALDLLIRYYGADADESTRLAPQIDAALARLTEAR